MNPLYYFAVILFKRRLHGENPIILLLFCDCFIVLHQDFGISSGKCTKSPYFKVQLSKSALLSSYAIFHSRHELTGSIQELILKLIVNLFLCRHDCFFILFNYYIYVICTIFMLCLCILPLSEIGMDLSCSWKLYVFLFCL